MRGACDMPRMLESNIDLRTEAILAIRVHTLDAIFNNLARQAALNAGEYLSAPETYLRLAFKAQSQCRATLETLAAIKNPAPVAFVRQANIALGRQQVNNAASPVVNVSRARENEIEQSKQSGGSHELLPDTRASTLTSGISLPVQAVGAVHRAEKPRR